MSTRRDGDMTAGEAQMVAYVNRQDARGRTALHYGADNGHVDIVKLLIRYDANVTIIDNDGHMALDLARIQGHTGVVEVLSRQ